MGKSTVYISKSSCYFLSLFMVLQSASVLAEEISPFRITTTAGSIDLRYLYDENEEITQGVTSRLDTMESFQQELFLNSTAYIYHPNFINMKLGGSLLFDQSEYDTLAEETSNNSDLINYYVHMDILEKKPYPLSLFYSLQHPSAWLGLANRTILDSISYGMSFSLLRPFSPVQVTVNAKEDITQGESADQITDETRQHASIRFDYSYGKANRLQLTSQATALDSRSGSPNLPIDPRVTTSYSHNLVANNLFGNQGQGILHNYLTYTRRNEYPTITDWKYSPDFRWQHSETMSSFYKYNYLNSSEESQETENNIFKMGLFNKSDSIDYSAGMNATDNQTNNTIYKSAGVNYSLNSKYPVASRGLRMSYGGGYDINDQKSDVSVLQVFDEPLVLIATTPVALQNSFVVYVNETNSSITVSNDSRTQTYIENLDYRVIVIGSVTEIQRLVTGSILDGQPLLVDYKYQTGGTYISDRLTQNLSFDYSYFRFYKYYLRYLFTNQDLVEGDPEIPLNSIRRTTTGFTADKPLSNGMMIGGELIYENNNEDVSPFIRNVYDAFVVMPLPKLTDVRLTARRELVDNEKSDEDVDLNRYTLNVNSRPWLRTMLGFDASYVKDTGGTVDRLQYLYRLRVGWQVRQLRMSLNALHVTEQLGVTDKDRWTIKFIAKREF